MGTLIRSFRCMGMWQRAIPAAMAILACGCIPNNTSPGSGISCGPAPTSRAVLNGAVGLSPTDLWAVGSYQNRGPSLPLTEHWDGHHWTIVSAPAGSWTDGAT